MTIWFALLAVWLVGLPLSFFALVVIYPRYLRWQLRHPSVSASPRSRRTGALRSRPH